MRKNIEKIKAWNEMEKLCNELCQLYKDVPQEEIDNMVKSYRKSQNK